MLLCAVFGLAATASAQQSGLPDAPKPRTAEPSAVSLRQLPRNFLQDQKAIWTSPRYLNRSSAAGPVLLTVAVAVMATTDRQVMREKVPDDPSLNQNALDASNALTAGLAATPFVFYGLGRMRGNQHAVEAGLVTGEAIVNSLLVSEVVKRVAARERPAANNASARFFQSDALSDPSFPSNHAAIAWSAASALASEYHGRLPFLAAYLPAIGVSAGRVMSRQHFPADALAGSVLGWMIGRYVAHRRQSQWEEEY